MKGYYQTPIHNNQNNEAYFESKPCARYFECVFALF